MRCARFLIVLSLTGTQACSSPSGPDNELAGHWWTGPLPSGGGIEVSIATNAAGVSGNGQSRAAGPNGAISLITVSGSQSGNTFVLTFTFDSGIIATYSGAFVDANKLAGPWSQPGQPAGFLTLYRRSIGLGYRAVALLPRGA